MTSAVRTVAFPSSSATIHRRRAPARHARERSRSQARTLASAVFGGLAGLAAATVFVAVAPAVGRDDVDGVARTTRNHGDVDRHREPPTSAVASVLAPAMPGVDSPEVRP